MIETITHAEPAPPQLIDNRRAAVNRENSQHSTGPRTPEGKKRASLNALRHGLTGHTIVLPTEDLAAYQLHCQRYLDDLQPHGIIEQQLVQTLSETAWRLNRIPALETNLLTLGITEHEAGINTSELEARTALAMAAALRDQTRVLATLSSHEQRLSRQFHRALAEIRATQADRRAKTEQQLKRAADLLEMHQNEDLPYNPADDGFVFSNAEIETHIRRRDRQFDATRSAPNRFSASA
jgi:hypothetical protein